MMIAKLVLSSYKREMRKMPLDPAIQSLAAFFLERNRRMEGCTHKKIYNSPPGEPGFIHITCLCGKLNEIQLSPKMHEDLVSNSSIREPQFQAEFQENKLIKLYGLDVVITEPDHKK